MKYFTIQELIVTSQKLNNTPSETSKQNLIKLVDNLLDPIREAWGSSIKVNSGYRSLAVNTAVGGSKTSQHMTGQAADISVGSKTENKKLFEFIKSFGLPFDQLIDEYGYQWIHISFADGKNRNQILHIS